MEQRVAMAGLREEFGREEFPPVPAPTTGGGGRVAASLPNSSLGKGEAG